MNALGDAMDWLVVNLIAKPVYFLLFRHPIVEIPSAPDKEGSFVPTGAFSYLGKVYPPSSSYKVVSTASKELRLLAYFNDEWVDVLRYNPSGWEVLSKSAMWSEKSLQMLAEEITTGK